MITKEVPMFDYQLLKMIRISTAKHEEVTIHGDVILDGNGKEIKDSGLLAKTDYKNAEILHKFYGMSVEEVLSITGFWVA